MKSLAIAVLISLVGSVAARGDVVLDQQYSFTSSIASSTNGDVSQMGQTFTVGVAGMLDHVDLLMFRLGGIFETDGDPLLRIFNTTGGLPTGSPLASVTIPEGQVPYNNAAFVSFDVSSAAIAVNPGDVLAYSVIATAGVGPYFLLNDSGQSPGYSGGAAIAKYGANPWQLITPQQDHGFKTFVNATTGPTADFDSDSLVDGADFLTWQRGFGTLTGATRTLGNSNAAEDGDVDAADLNVWQTQFGGGGATSTISTIPEPAAATLASLAYLACRNLKRRARTN